MRVNIKRIYDSPSPSDGFRVLIDRLWPRGVSKEKANLDLWLKGAAPSTQLRQWFNHDSAKFKEFSLKYQDELDKNPAVDDLRHILKTHKTVTLLFGAKDVKINHAIVLKNFLAH